MGRGLGCFWEGCGLRNQWFPRCAVCWVADVSLSFSLMRVRPMEGGNGKFTNQVRNDSDLNSTDDFLK